MVKDKEQLSPFKGIATQAKIEADIQSANQRVESPDRNPEGG